MPFLDLVQDKAWALHPSKLDEINAFIEARLDDPKASIEVARGKSGAKADDRYEVKDGVAIIPVYGVIAQRMNLFMEFSGGTSTELLQRDIQSALDDSRVDAIVLDVDSPGGSVNGTKDVSDFIFESRSKKPIIAYAGGMMASAAYWIGSAADAVVANETAMVGSIGVALTHFDRSGADEKAGIKRTLIYSGKYKRIASDEKPLTEDGREYLQAMTDTYYSIFVEGVSRNRDSPIETVLAEMADGKDFIGKQAKKAGLVDDVGTLKRAITLARKKVKQMDMTLLQEKHPDLYQQVFDLGAASVDVATAEKVAAQNAVAQERSRVAEILNTDGDASVINQAIKDGTPANDIFKLLWTSRGKALETMQSSLSESAGQSGGEKPGVGPTKAFMNAVDAYQAEKQCSRIDALKAVAAQHPELHEEYLNSLREKGE